MSAISHAAQRKSLNQPDETRNFPKGKVDLVTVRDLSIGRGTFEPGWKWSECVKPIAGTERCEAPHMAYFISGRMRAVMDDGQELEFGPGDVMWLPPGHDAWVVGDQQCVVVDFGGFEDYAKQ